MRDQKLRVLREKIENRLGQRQARKSPYVQEEESMPSSSVTVADAEGFGKGLRERLPRHFSKGKHVLETLCKLPGNTGQKKRARPLQEGTEYDNRPLSYPVYFF